MFGQVRGITMETFISESQDRQRNALSKSVQAAFNAWQEQLGSDQILFEQAQIMSLVCNCQRQDF